MSTTDVAVNGWGASLEIGDQSYQSFGYFLESDSLSSSNQGETAAVLRALTTLRTLLEDANVHGMTIRSDNTATVCNLQR
jgi:ribonuclease HI